MQALPGVAKPMAQPARRKRRSALSSAAEPAVDRGEKIVRLVSFALIASDPGCARRCAQQRRSLDRLAPSREMAQIASALGRQFSHELISAVAQMPQHKVNDALVQLVRAELIFQHGTPPDAEYTFKHALVQDATYSTLLHSRRRQLHAEIAAILERRFPEIAAAQPQLMAHHFSEADLNEAAIDYYLKAGRQDAQELMILNAPPLPGDSSWSRPSRTRNDRDHACSNDSSPRSKANYVPPSIRGVGRKSCWSVCSTRRIAALTFANNVGPLQIYSRWSVTRADADTLLAVECLSAIFRHIGAPIHRLVCPGLVCLSPDCGSDRRHFGESETCQKRDPPLVTPPGRRSTVRSSGATNRGASLSNLRRISLMS
jgi:hypothetical protein